MGRPLLLSALVFLTPSVAAAQAPARVHISFGYRYVRAASHSILATSATGLTALPLGGEFGVAVRLSPVVSVVGAIGSSWSTRVVVPDKAATQSTPASMGTARFSVFDAMGGVKFSKAGRAPFVEVLAGISVPHTSFEGTSTSGNVLNQLDLGLDRRFTLRPMAGVDFGNSSRRLGGRIEAGWDIVPRVDAFSSKPETLWHFRVAASATMGVGKPFVPAPRADKTNPLYVSFTAGFELKEPGSKITNTNITQKIPVGAIAVGGRVAKRLGIEAVVATEPSRSIDWMMRYLFAPYTNDRSTHRDTLLLGQARVLGLCEKTVCIEAFGGGGFVAHHAVDFIVADCGTDFRPKNPCETVTPPKWNYGEWQWGLALAGGAAVTFVVSPKVSIGPSAQVSYLGHSHYLFSQNQRGPTSGSRVVPSFGVVLTIKP